MAITKPVTRPVTRAVTRGVTDLEISPVRATVVGNDLQYPLGTSLRRTLRGVNLGNYGTVTSANCVAIAAQLKADGVSLVRLVSNLRWFGDYGVAGTDSRDDNCYASFGAPNRTTFFDILKALTDQAIWVIPTFDSDCAINGGTQPGEAPYCEAQVQAGETPQILNSDGTWTVLGGTWAAAGGYHAMSSPLLLGKIRGIWKMLALELMSYPYILACELGAEPLGASGTFVYSGAQWPGAISAMYQAIISDFRAADPVTPLVIGGKGYTATNIAAAILSLPGLMYAFNKLSGGLTDLANLPSSFDDACVNNVLLLSDQMGSLSSADTNDYALHAGWMISIARGIITTWWNGYDKTTNANGYGWRYSDGAGGFIDKQPRLASSQYFMTITLAAIEAAAIAAATAEGAVLFYVKADFSNAFQDSAGTVPVTALGQPLGLINPVVGSGLTFLQATALARPTVAVATPYLIDQRPVISFDGVNSIMNGSSTFFASGGQITVIASVIATGGATIQDILHCGGSTATAKWPRLQCSAAHLATAVFQTDTTTATITGATSTAAGFPLVMSCIRDGSENKSLISNGVQDGATDTSAAGTIASLTRLRLGGTTVNNTPTLTGVIGLICLKAGTMATANKQAIARLAALLVGAGYQV